MKSPQNIEALLEEANRLELYQKLILQLNKDLQLANIDLEFDKATIPSSLKLILHETIYNLIHEKFVDYLNLLYIIDVPENKVKQINGSDTLLLAQEISFLILKREWQKVWFKHHYS